MTGDGEEREGSNVVIGLPINIFAGDGSLESTGDARRSSMARCRLFLLLTFFDDLLDGLHLSLCEPIGLWEPG